jgi:hypothetical protein
MKFFLLFFLLKIRAVTIGDSKRAELMVKWRQVRIAAMKVLADRAELANDQANLILKELKKSTN